MRLAVVGTGYVGLTAGAAFAHKGHEVVCSDIDEQRIIALRQGVMPFYEPGLEELVRNGIAEGNLRFTTEHAAAVADARIAFIAVGTPTGARGAYESTYVRGAVRDVSRAWRDIDEDRVIAIKSTINTMIFHELEEMLEEQSTTDALVHLASNPEFMAQGSAVNDFLKPHRIAIGTRSEEAAQLLRAVYEPFVHDDPQKIRVYQHPESAIIGKSLANAFLAERPTKMNEAARICDANGGDILEVRDLIMRDPRVGGEFLWPGPGFGGSCFDKDIRDLAVCASDVGVQTHLLPAILASNAAHKQYIADRIAHALSPSGDLAGARIAVWGLSFKAGTDDMRDAPSVPIITSWLDRGAQVHAHDPKAIANARRALGDRVTYHEHKYDAARGADALVLLTEWGTYDSPDYAELRFTMRQPLLFDMRNRWNPQAAREAGLIYAGMGRK